MSTKRPPIDWDAQPLGIETDGEIARRLGVSAEAVGAQRKKRGIRRVHRPDLTTIGKPSGIDWDAQPLGVETDGEIARRLGVSQVAVNMQRRKRGIPAVMAFGSTAAALGGLASAQAWLDRGGVDWDAQPLGQEPDASLARRLGVSPTTVAKQRTNRGIERRQSTREPVPRKRAKAPQRGTPREKVGTHVDWSTVAFDGPDQAVADRLGVPLMVVYQHRRALGIPTYQSRKRESRMQAAANRAAQHVKETRARRTREDEAIRLQGEGLTQTEIGRRLGVSRARVGQIIAKARARRTTDRSARRAAVRALIARVRRQLATAELRRRRLAHEAEARRAPPLSPRYAEVLRLSSEGLTYEEIGGRLGGVNQAAGRADHAEAQGVRVHVVEIDRGASARP